MNAAELTQRQIAMMSPADRKALGVLTVDECRVKHEAQEEAPLQKLCEQELSRRNIVFLHLSFRAREKIGWPDLVFCLHGKPMAVELKSAHGRLTDEQRYTLNRMEGNGWHVDTIRSFEAFRELLK